MTVSYAVGGLVTARNREWVVLNGSAPDFLVLRPLGGTDDDVAGVFPELEPVRPATFALPTPDDLGDDHSARLLRDALRIGFRSSGGPFRSLASLGVTPRPYQLVPLLLALRQESVRLLIADDVGVGKTVEAGLIAAELLAQGSARRLTVLAPPSLAEQWRGELGEKFGLNAELVLPGTIRRLERGLAQDESVFERHRITVVSTDFIKAEHRRHDFQRAAPDLVIVDEAHSCADDDSGRGGGRTQRYQLVRALAQDPDRHLILVSATPHSGNDGAFRNLIGLLNPALRTVDLAGEPGRRLLSEHMVQRRRADIRQYIGTETKFPKDRQTQEIAYVLSPEHRALFDDVLAYVRGEVQDRSGTSLQQRIRWWSALSLLRAMASSPAAVEATLRTRASSAEAETAESVDRLGSSEILDQIEDDGSGSADMTPGAITEERDNRSGKHVLSEFRRRAADLVENSASDAKLQELTRQVKRMLTDGYHPIVFCRFIPTAHYLLAHLRSVLKKGTAVEVVTGEHPSQERAERVRALAERAGDGPKVLVATDCLSEGVNLQDEFQAVIHADLAWNPTRHEQREGRVDRFGQPKETVRALLLYGEDNGIDGIVLDVLLRKHERIRKDLGISVPVPPQSDQVLAALLEGVLMRGHRADQLELDLGLQTQAEQLEFQWRSSAEEERKSYSRFAQRAISPDEVQTAVDTARRALGSPEDVARFTRAALAGLGCDIIGTPRGFRAETSLAPPALQQTLGPVANFVTDFPKPRDAAVLTRNDPTVAGLAQYLLDSALDPALPARHRPARRCGVVATDRVTTVTTAVLVRFRTQLILPSRNGPIEQLAEQARVLAFTGSASAPVWLTPHDTEELLAAPPTANTPPDVAKNQIAHVLSRLPELTPHLNEWAVRLAEELREDHATVRRAARGDRAGALGVRGLTVTAKLPVDVLGVYVYRPAGGAR